MPVEVEGMLEGHHVTLDASSEWPRIFITCTCGWEVELDGDAESAMKDGLTNIFIHTGGPKHMKHGEREVTLPAGTMLDRNALSARIDALLGS